MNERDIENNDRNIEKRCLLKRRMRMREEGRKALISHCQENCGSGNILFKSGYINGLLYIVANVVQKNYPYLAQ